LSPDYEHITAELSGRKKAHVYLTGKGSGASAYDNMSMTGESIMTRGPTGYAIDTNLSTGNYSLAGASASQATVATATAHTSNTTAAVASESSQDVTKWHDDPQAPGYVIRWNVRMNQWQRKKKET
jgi:hypothetical protein